MTEKADNFGGLPEEFVALDRAKIAILPIPFDGTSTWLKGADRGPQAILDASANMELYDIETKSEVYRQGIFTAKPIVADTTATMVRAAEEATKKLLKAGKFVFTLGGEHSISYGPIKAHADHFGDITVLQLDAHTDLRDIYHEDPHNHACIMARVKDLGLKIVSVGIRAIDSSELPNIAKTTCFYAESVVGREGWQKDVLKALGPKVYITLDLDVFDPAVMSSTGTPEPGGLGWYETIKLLRMVATERELVGCDVVELMPRENRAPDFLAAKLVYKILSYQFELKK